MITLLIGRKLHLSINRLGINGEGIGYFKRRLIFVPGALPNEEVDVEITENQRNFSRAKLLKVRVKSDQRVQPACSVYEECGGCQLMHLAYPAQLDFKRDLLEQALYKYRPTGYEFYELRPTIGMQKPAHYRNKLQFQLSFVGGRTIAGLYQADSHRLVSLKDCLVQTPLTQKIMNRICQLIDKYQLKIDDERKIKGLKTVMIRESRATKEVQIVFVQSAPMDLSRLLSNLTDEFPQIVGIATNEQKSKSSQIFGEATEPIYGRETITEQVLNYDFELSPRAFFQLNSQQANILYDEAIKALAPVKSDRVVDAYCGVGTIGFGFARQVKSVHGMDITPEAIQDAKKNALALGLKNCHYETGRAERIIPNWYKSGHRPTAILVDPPRTGLDEGLLQTILTYQPDKMVYVSCNVSTLAKDLTFLAEAYRVDYIQSVDMFPHTSRTEAVVRLTRKGKIKKESRHA